MAILAILPPFPKYPIFAKMPFLPFPPFWPKCRFSENAVFPKYPLFPVFPIFAKNDFFAFFAVLPFSRNIRFFPFFGKRRFFRFSAGWRKCRFSRNPDFRKIRLFSEMPFLAVMPFPPPSGNWGFHNRNIRISGNLGFHPPLSDGIRQAGRQHPAPPAAPAGWRPLPMGPCLGYRAPGPWSSIWSVALGPFLGPFLWSDSAVKVSDSVIDGRLWPSCLAGCAPPRSDFRKARPCSSPRHPRHIVHRKCSAAENRRRFFVLFLKQKRLFGFSNRSVQVPLNRRRFLGSDSHGTSFLGVAYFPSSTVGQRRRFLGHNLNITWT